MMPMHERAAQAKTTSMIGLVVGSIFSAFNLLTPGMFWLGMAELSGVVFFVVPAAYLCRYTDKIPLSETLLMFATGVIFGSLVVFGGIGGTGIFWVFTAPFVAFFIKDQRPAWAFSGGLWLLIGAYLLSGVSHRFSFAYRYDEISALHFWLALGFYTVVAAAFANIRTRYADKLLLARQRAEDDVLAKSRFLAAASHDLRQPAHAMGLFVGRLQQVPHSPEARELVRGVDDSVRALQYMLNEFFDYSRLGLPSMEVKAVDFAMERVLGMVRDSFESQALAKGLRLKVRPSRAWVHADPALVQRILINLVANAVQYTHRGRVVVACRVVDGGRALRLEVWDTGIGIAPALQEKVFNEFYQIENPERDRAKGFGLGLSIVRLACQRGDYALRLNSQPGKGSRFCVTLPIAVAPMEVMTIADADIVPTSTETGEGEGFNALVGCKVLLVEDDPLGGAAVRQLLRGWGCEVLAAINAADALDCLKQGFVPELVLSDYRLPGGKSGLDVVVQVRAVVGGVPACLVSGDTDPGLRAQALAMGVPLLQKPVRPAKLRAALRNLRVQSRHASQS
jgi:signal transduction histidine kinase/CheY-like chemotaxis protein